MAAMEGNSKDSGDVGARVLRRASVLRPLVQMYLSRTASLESGTPGYLGDRYLTNEIVSKYVNAYASGDLKTAAKTPVSGYHGVAVTNNPNLYPDTILRQQAGYEGGVPTPPSNGGYMNTGNNPDNPNATGYHGNSGNSNSNSNAGSTNNRNNPGNPNAPGYHGSNSNSNSNSNGGYRDNIFGLSCNDSLTGNDGDDLLVGVCASMRWSAATAATFISGSGATAATPSTMRELSQARSIR